MIDDRMRSFLVESGYRLDVRVDGFVTLLVSKGGERWIGNGADAEEALADAVAQMFPSSAAEDLLAAVLADDEHSETDGEEPEEQQVESDEDREAPGEETEPHGRQPPPPDPEAPPVPEDHEALAGDADPGDPPLPEPSPDPDEQETLLDLEEVKSPEPSAPPMKKKSAKPRLPVRDALEQLESLQDEIDDLLPEVAWTAPPLVRLQLTTWLARARDLQEAAGHHKRVEDAVRRLAGRLGSVTKRWWPGNVAALQLYTVPGNVNQQLRLGLGERSSWGDVADAIERRLDAAGDGWADEAALAPRPNAIDHTFERICANLAALLGPLDREPGQGALAHVDDTHTRRSLQEWARRLRWMRGVAPSGERWACAMGHLRWLAQHSGGARRYLEPALDPDLAPREGTWAKALGEDPERRRRQRRVRRVLRSTPNANADRETLAAWLADALALGADLTNRQVIGLIPEHPDAVLALHNEDLGDVERKVRSRLRKLQKALSAGESAAPAPEIEEGQDEVEEPAGGADPVGDLVDAVRARVEGKKAVFISNRADPNLKSKLEERLGLQLEWCEGSPRRVQAVGTQIAAGTYDLVILATGFAGHSADAVLSKAASTAGVPFVRAYKGRSLATLRSLARDLGIRRES